MSEVLNHKNWQSDAAGVEPSNAMVRKAMWHKPAFTLYQAWVLYKLMGTYSTMHIVEQAYRFYKENEGPECAEVSYLEWKARQ